MAEYYDMDESPLRHRRMEGDGEVNGILMDDDVRGILCGFSVSPR